MAKNTIDLVIKVNNSEAIASIELTNENIKELYKSFKYGKAEVNGFETSLSQGFNNAREIIQGFKETYSVMMGLLGTPVKVYADFEQANVSFEVLLGNADKAKQMINDLREFGAKTPLEFTGLQRNAQLLLSFGIEAEKILPTLKMLGDISGGNAQKMDSLTLAFAQMSSTGRLMGQDLLQMINAGFNPLQIISEQTGKSIGELKKEMESGAISSEMITQAFKDATSEGGRFYGMLEKQSGTVAGAISNFNDNITQIQQNIGGALVVAFNPLLDTINKITSSLNTLSPELTGAIGALGVLSAAGYSLKMTGLLPLIGSFSTLRREIGYAIGLYKMASVEIGRMGAVSMATSTAMKGLWASIGPAGWLILGLSAVTIGFELLGNEADDLNAKMDTTKQKLDEEAGKYKFLAEKVKDTNLSLDERKTALEKLQEKYPGFLSDLNLEKDANEDVAKAVNNSISAYKRKIALQAYEKELENVLTEKVKKEEEYNKALERQTNLEKRLKDAKKRDLGSEIFATYVNELELQKEKVSELKEELDKYGKESDAIFAKINSYSDSDKKEKNTQITLQRKINELKAKEKKLTEEYMALSPEEASKRKLEYEKEIVAIRNDIKGLELDVKVKTTKSDKIEIPVRPEIDIDADIEESLREMAESEIEITEVSQRRIEQIKAESLDNQFEKQRRMLELQKQEELEKLKEEHGNAVNYTEAKLAIEEKYAKEKKKINDEEERAEEQLAEAKRNARINSALGTLNALGSFVNEQTAAGKGIAVAQATINTYVGATKALEQGGILGILHMGAIIAAGMAQVNNILSTEPPKMPAYEKGGAIVGEKGVEIIAPAKDFASGMDRLIYETVNQVKYSLDAAKMSNGGNAELLREIRALKAEIRGMNNRPINLSTELKIDRKTAAKIYVEGENQTRGKRI
jgi:tape measure domain-containing protein